MTETSILKEIQVAVSNFGARVFRNNVGVLKDARGQHVTYGLCPGSSDLIGWTRDGRFLAIEVKKPGSKTSPERLLKQTDFIDAVRRAGGVAFFAESVVEAIEKMERWNGK